MNCQLCGGNIKGKPYFWDDDQRLPMHQKVTSCDGRNPQDFADFMNRNASYINGRGAPVLRGNA